VTIAHGCTHVNPVDAAAPRFEGDAALLGGALGMTSRLRKFSEQQLLDWISQPV